MLGKISMVYKLIGAFLIVSLIGVGIGVFGWGYGKRHNRGC